MTISVCGQCMLYCIQICNCYLLSAIHTVWSVCYFPSLCKSLFLYTNYPNKQLVAFL